MDHIGGSVILCGAKNPGELLGNVESMGQKLKQDEINMIESVSREK